jgi:hypothetical protein
VCPDRKPGRWLLPRHLWQNAESLGDLACAAGLAWTASARAQSPQVELVATAVTSAALFCNFLTMLLPFKRFGVLVITIVNMLTGDIFHFLVRAILRIFGYEWNCDIIHERVYRLKYHSHEWKVHCDE